MTELQKIRKNFQNILREWFDIAHSLIAMASTGSDIISEYMIKNPDSSYKFAVPISTSIGQDLATINDLKYSEIFEIYSNHKQASVELVYGRIVQQWYDFLSQINEQIVTESIKGTNTSYKIPKIKIELDFSVDDILEQIPKIVTESFDFLPSEEKLRRIETSLGKKLTVDIKQYIKIAVIVRNILEHHQGIIRDKEMKLTGTNSIKLINNSCVEEDFLIGSRVQITIYELFKLKNAFYHAANQLIPD